MLQAFSIVGLCHLNITSHIDAVMTLENHHTSGKKRKRRDSGDAVSETPEVGLINLQMNTLRCVAFSYYDTTNCRLMSKYCFHALICFQSTYSAFPISRRYKRHFKLQTKPGLNKAQLAESMQRHFSAITVVEKEALAYFIYMVKMKKNRIDMKENSNDYSSNSSNQRQKGP